MKKQLYLILMALLVAAACGISLIVARHTSPEPSRVSLTPARISEIKEMVRLCSTEIYEEAVMKGATGTRRLVAREVLTGSIEFDIDSIEISQRGDTLVVKLPPEIVTVRESTRPESYTVIDAWDTRPLSTARLTTEEENRIKAQFEADAVVMIYRKGYVARARSEAAASLRRMLTTLTGSDKILITGI